MNLFSILKASCVLSLTLSGCGPSDGNGSGKTNNSSGDGPALAPDASTCVPTSTTEFNCNDSKDDDCDGKIDCESTACASSASCRNDISTPDGGDSGPNTNEGCGEATYPGEALAIPDGNGTAYETSVNITGFDNGQLLENATGFVSACVTMEHSWLRDLQIEMVCPSGQVVVLQKYLGQNGSELHMGTPDDSDSVDPVPGIGAEYCWTTNAINPPMLDWANANEPPILSGIITKLPAGDYKPSTSMDALVGCTLNGDWKIRAIDDWAVDNGYIFEWKINFNPDIISDCGNWID